MRKLLPHRAFVFEAPPGFEPGNEGFADLCLTTWLWRREAWGPALYAAPHGRVKEATTSAARCVPLPWAPRNHSTPGVRVGPPGHEESGCCTGMGSTWRSTRHSAARCGRWWTR